VKTVNDDVLQDSMTRSETANTTSVMRVMNERAVFERIRQLGPVSRPQLAHATSLSKPTVSQALSNLERSGLVRTAGHRTGSAGRSAQLYEMRPEAGWTVGVDIGRSWVRLALANIVGDIVARLDERSQAKSPATLLKQLGGMLQKATAEVGITPRDVTASVIGSPGVYDPERRLLRLAPSMPGWEKPGSLDALTEVFGENITVENDIDLAALGEQAYGLSRDLTNVVFVSIGTGIGMGIILGGHLYRGTRGAAGEISFLPLGADEHIEPVPAKGPRRHGLLERTVGADGVVAAAQRLGWTGAAVAKDIFDAARDGDPTAQRAVEEEVEHLSHGLAAITAILDPELIVMGGGIGRNGDLLIGPMTERLKALAPLTPPRIALSALGDDAALLGAVATGLSRVREVVITRATAMGA
jgi:predicted NBD/HSP70 family sugar kinase